ncbi:hypothetical protein [Pyxidicoccus sp. MSG2]|nr:hypothetical protein [Pyxidicoccus sp. MSG2]MCY1024050.1 hypothetical protein [Pyxidicoccus sp. MSG2]
MKQSRREAPRPPALRAPRAQGRTRAAHGEPERLQELLLRASA